MSSEKKTRKHDAEHVGDTTLRQRPPDGAGDVPARYRASIVIRKGRKKGAEYSLAAGRTVLGRGSGSDIILDDPAVSRMHAAIEFSGSVFVLKDLGSSNGTMMDGKSIKEADLAHGDTFQLGDTVVEFVLAEHSGGSVYVIE